MAAADELHGSEDEHAENESTCSFAKVSEAALARMAVALEAEATTPAAA